MVDGTLMFGTGIDNSGFTSGVSNLQAQANVALGNIARILIFKQFHGRITFLQDNSRRLL